MAESLTHDANVDKFHTIEQELDVDAVGDEIIAAHSLASTALGPDMTPHLASKDSKTTGGDKSGKGAGGGKSGSDKKVDTTPRKSGSGGKGKNY